MIDRVKSLITKHNLIDTTKPIIVGLSGGADSVALIHLMNQWKIPIIAAHCNFHLRGKESDRDCRFVETFAKSLNIECHIKHFDTYQYAKEKGISIEMAARELRYEWFEIIRTNRNAQAIAIAHHQDDRIETILLNILRGTGIRGLVALHPKNGNIVRPLLAVKRKDILDYCKKNSLQYVEDSTNAQAICQRNRVRLELIPLMQSISNGASNRIIRMAEQLEYSLQLVEIETEHFLEKHCQNLANYSRIPIKEILNHINPQGILFEIIHPLSFNSADLDDIISSFKACETKQFFSKTNRIIKERDFLYITDLATPDQTSHHIYEDKLNNKLPITLKLKVTDYNPNLKIETSDRNTIFLDYDKLTFPLTLRRYKKGEKFAPINMKGQKLVSDYLKDQKTPLLDRENCWVITSHEQIVWIVGQRPDDRFKITQYTRHICSIMKID